MPVKIFFCYAHEDEPLLNKLKTHLRPLQQMGLIDVWYDRDISAGTKWEEEINTRLNEANIILLLVSPDFMDSDYCYEKEMQRALERGQRGEASVIPVILRPVYWQGLLGGLQALPKDGVPILDRHWFSDDEAFSDAVEGIRKVVENLNTKLLVNPSISSQVEDNAKTTLLMEQKTTVNEKTIQNKRKYITRQGRELIGREKEIAEIYKLLQKDNISLLTLHGSPGVGKTEIALQIYQEARRHRFFDRIFPPVSLEPIKRADEVYPTIADSLGLKLEELITVLKKGRNLLILDNFEHLMDASKQISQLLIKCRESLTILITSRKLLMSEKSYHVSPLTLPAQKQYKHLSVETLKTYTAIELFLERAEAKDGTPFPLTVDNAPLVVSLCSNLDGNPLAINLAASIVNELGLQELIDLLNKREFFGMEYLTDNEWQSSLDILIWSSYERLSPSEQKLFRRLAVFIGGCDIRTADAVCNRGDLANIRNCAISLSKWNLIVMQNSRLEMVHNIIRVYALHKLEEDKIEEVEIRNRHRDFYEEKARTYFCDEKGNCSYLHAFKKYVEAEIAGKKTLSDLLDEDMKLPYLSNPEADRFYHGFYASAETQAIIHELPNFYAAYEWANQVEGKLPSFHPLWCAYTWGGATRYFGNDFLDPGFGFIISSMISL